MTVNNNSNKENMKTIEQLNSDLTLDDTKIIWAGQKVLLYTAGNYLGKLLASFTADEKVQAKITAWCNKNSYRCSQMHDNKIWL